MPHQRARWVCSMPAGWRQWLSSTIGRSAEADNQTGAMSPKEASRRDMAALAFAAACIPTTKAALMFWECRMDLPSFPFIEPAALPLALSSAIFTVSFLPCSWMKRFFRGAAIIAWSGLAYLIVVFIPGSSVPLASIAKRLKRTRRRRSNACSVLLEHDFATSSHQYV
jgi:hypothetical protein